MCVTNLMKVIRIHPEFILDICTTFHGKPFSIEKCNSKPPKTQFWPLSKKCVSPQSFGDIVWELN